MGVPGDRPEIDLELQPAGLRVSWGPQKGLWGIFKEDMKDHPAEVKIKEWWLFVGEKLGQKPGHVKEIFNKSVGTNTEMIIPGIKLPQHKTVVVQVLGSFDSKNINGDPFVEAIYSDEREIEIK